MRLQRLSGAVAASGLGPRPSTIDWLQSAVTQVSPPNFGCHLTTKSFEVFKSHHQLLLVSAEPASIRTYYRMYRIVYRHALPVPPSRTLQYQVATTMHKCCTHQPRPRKPPPLETAVCLQ